MHNHKVYIIGIGDNGAKSLSEEARRRVESADLIFGGERHLEFFPQVKAEKRVVKSNLKEVAQTIKAQMEKQRIVVLASGDPLFYGIGKYLFTKIPKEHFDVLPSISSMQLAFAKVRESWDDAVLVSLHAKPIEDLFEAAGEAKKIGLFTDDENTPNRIAAELVKNGFGPFKVYVCENLGGEDERIVEGDLTTVAAKQFAPLNVMILVKQELPDDETHVSEVRGARCEVRTFGLPDHAFFQRKPKEGLITKSEVRVISLSKMRLKPSDVVWDIGAGSGSVSIESAFLVPQGKVYAIEKNLEDCDLIRKNVEKFKTPNVTVIHGLAPDCLGQISDDPDAIFIGGSAGSMTEIIALSCQRLHHGGCIVVNAATIENLSEAVQALSDKKLSPQTLLVQISRSKPILDLTRFESLNPVFIIWAEK